jgi:hypothetical protein
MQYCWVEAVFTHKCAYTHICVFVKDYAELLICDVLRKIRVEISYGKLLKLLHESDIDVLSSHQIGAVCYLFSSYCIRSQLISPRASYFKIVL